MVGDSLGIDGQAWTGARWVWDVGRIVLRGM